MSGAFTVDDEGGPIDAALAERAFDRFTRGDSARTGTGTGLGLSIVEAIATAHGGTTGLEPSPSGGTRAWLRLPAKPDLGPHTVNGRSEKPLTGDTEAKVRAAALAKVSGTVERVETNVDSSAPYEAHIRKSDGTEVEVQVSKDFSVAAVDTMGRH
jgi:hypothetical protein